MVDILFHRMRNTAGNHDGIFLINDIIYLQQIPKSGICSFFDLVIRPIIRFYFSSENFLVLTLSIPLQIKYVLTGQLYMQVPVKIWIIAAFKIKKGSWLVHKLYYYSLDLSWALKFVSHILRQMGYLLKRFYRICRIFSTPFFLVIYAIFTPFL